MSAALARWLRRLADRIDHAGAPKIMGWSFTYETSEGIRFRQDGRGCPLAYLSDEAYERAHTEATGMTAQVYVGTIPAGSLHAELVHDKHETLNERTGQWETDYEWNAP